MSGVRPEEYDLVVVGGGPAGLATAICSAQAGLDAVVIEGRRPPVDRACGEGIMPDGVAALSEMGIEIGASSSSVFVGIRYFDGPVRAEARFPQGGGLGVRRVVLHDALRTRAEELGVRLLWGEKVTGLHPDGVQIDGGAMLGRWVVGADGRTSPLRRMAGLEGRAPRGSRLGVRRHYRIAPWSDLVEVHWADGCELYVTPVASDLVGVAALTHHGGGRFDEVLAAFPAVESRLQGAPVASRDRGAGPFGQRCRQPIEGRVVLVGDAGDSLDPITGEGLSVAFHQARELVACIAEGRVDEYPTIHRRLLRVPKTLTGLLTFAAGHPPVRRRVIKALASSPSLFERCLAISSRSADVGLTGRHGILTLAWDLALHGI